MCPYSWTDNGFTRSEQECIHSLNNELSFKLYRQSYPVVLKSDEWSESGFRCHPAGTFPTSGSVSGTEHVSPFLVVPSGLAMVRTRAPNPQRIHPSDCTIHRRAFCPILWICVVLAASPASGHLRSRYAIYTPSVAAEPRIISVLR